MIQIKHAQIENIMKIDLKFQEKNGSDADK